MQKNVSSQKLVVYAFDSTTNLPKTGDAANITAYVSKDYGSVTVLGDTSATEMDATNAKGYYLFDLTQTETNADTLLFSAKSSTANIVVIGVPAVVFTTPSGFNTSVAQTGDSYARLGAPAGASIAADLAEIEGETDTLLAGVIVTTNNDKTGYTLTVTPPTAAAIATAVWQDATAGDFTTASSIGKSLYNAFTANTSVYTVAALANAPVTAAAPSAAAVASAVCDVVNTAATHNVTNSLGKQIRLINPTSDVIYPLSGTVNLASATSTTAVLDAGASNVAQAYQWNVLSILSGTGSGQSRLISNYAVGRTATITPAWATTPDNTSTFEITPTSLTQVASYVATQDPATLVLNAAAASYNTAGSIGQKINAAGSASDPLTSAVPGAYVSGTAGYVLGHIGGARIAANTALPSFAFMMYDSTNHRPQTGLAVTPTRSLDGAAFAACANGVTEMSGGWYKINLAAADLNGTVIALRFTAPAADDTDILVVTQG